MARSACGTAKQANCCKRSEDIRGMLLLWHSHLMAAHSPVETMTQFTFGMCRPEYFCTRLRDTQIWWIVLRFHLTVSSLRVAVGTGRSFCGNSQNWLLIIKFISQPTAVVNWACENSEYSNLLFINLFMHNLCPTIYPPSIT